MFEDYIWVILEQDWYNALLGRCVEEVSGGEEITVEFNDNFIPFVLGFLRDARHVEQCVIFLRDARISLCIHGGYVGG